MTAAIPTRAEVVTVIDMLAAMWPRCFVAGDGPRRPLSLYMRKALRRELPDMPDAMLDEVMRRYTSDRRYVRAIVEGAGRVRLDGEIDGIIDAETARRAARRQAAQDCHAEALQAVRRLKATLATAAGYHRAGDARALESLLAPYEQPSPSAPAGGG